VTETEKLWVCVGSPRCRWFGGRGRITSSRWQDPRGPATGRRSVPDSPSWLVPVGQQDSGGRRRR
jgi:uncharacterized protein YodC (DUF2158 family)